MKATGAGSLTDPLVTALDDVETAMADLSARGIDKGHDVAHMAAYDLEHEARWRKVREFDDRVGAARVAAQGLLARSTGTGQGLPVKEIIKQAWEFADVWCTTVAKKRTEAGLDE